MKEVPIWEKSNLSLEEAAAYSGIGINKLRELTNEKNCSLVAVGHIIDAHVIREGSVLRTAVIFFYLSNEGISILENAARTGLPIPGKLKAVLEQLRDEKDNQ